VVDPDSDGDGTLDEFDDCPFEPPTGGLDADENGCPDMILGLAAIVDALPMTAVGRRGLLRKLDAAIDAVERGHFNVAENKLSE